MYSSPGGSVVPPRPVFNLSISNEGDTYFLSTMQKKVLVNVI